MYEDHSKNTGSYFFGEIKLDVTLCLLTCGDAPDKSIIFNIYSDHYTTIMNEVLTKWIVSSDIGMMNMPEYLGDYTDVNRVSLGFPKRSRGDLKGDIGALDGWLVRIVRPE